MLAVLNREVCQVKGLDEWIIDIIMSLPTLTWMTSCGWIHISFHLACIGAYLYWTKFYPKCETVKHSPVCIVRPWSTHLCVLWSTIAQTKQIGTEHSGSAQYASNGLPPWREQPEADATSVCSLFVVFDEVFLSFFSRYDVISAKMSVPWYLILSISSTRWHANTLTGSEVTSPRGVATVARHTGQVISNTWSGSLECVSFWRHCMQNVCWHGRRRGSVKISRQTGHIVTSSIWRSIRDAVSIPLATDFVITLTMFLAYSDNDSEIPLTEILLLRWSWCHSVIKQSVQRQFSVLIVTHRVANWHTRVHIPACMRLPVGLRSLWQWIRLAASSSN